MSHKFQCQQMVMLNQPAFQDSRSAPITVYEVVRLMPEDRMGEVSYRIKAGTVERAVRESEIRAT